jgi:hypothetical protein
VDTSCSSNWNICGRLFPSNSFNVRGLQPFSGLTSHPNCAGIGPIQATKKEQQTILIPPILSWVAIGGGVVLIFVGLRRMA